MKLSLENAEDIKRAESMVSWLNRPQIEDVILALPWLDAGLRERTAKKTKFLFNDCGCFWGGPSFLIVFSIHFFPGLSMAGFSWRMLGFSFLYGMAAGVTAKFLGLTWSLYRLKRLLRSLRPPVPGINQ